MYVFVFWLKINLELYAYILLTARNIFNETGLGSEVQVAILYNIKKRRVIKMIENSVATVENAIMVGNHTLPIKEYNNVRVVTFKDIDTVHERPDGTASRNFRKNREHFVENEDYFIIELTADEIRRQFQVGKNAGRTAILITESGYLMLVKSFTDDLAWKVQRELVNTYFRVKDITSVVIAMAEKITQLEKSNNDKFNTLEAKIDKVIPTQSNYYLWKNSIATPLVKTVSNILGLPIADTYKVIYDDMVMRGFNQPYAMNRFCNKYKVDSVSTIDAVADVDEYIRMFMDSANKFLEMNISASDTSTAKSKVNNNIIQLNQIIDYSTLTVEKIIKPLVELYHDTSVNNAYTYKRVYKIMRSDRSWKALMTRRHCRSKKELVVKFNDIRRDFAKAVNQLMGAGTVEAGGEV